MNATSQIITTILLGLSICLFSNHLTSQANSTPEQVYESFCLDSDTACIQREIDFIKANHRGPVTDSELADTYGPIAETWWNTNIPQYHTQRPLDATIVCEDCFTK